MPLTWPSYTSVNQSAIILILLFQSELSRSEDAPRDRPGLGKDREHGEHVPGRGRGVEPGSGSGGGEEAGGGGQCQAQLPRHLQDPGTHRPCTSREKGGLRIKRTPEN